MTALLMDHVLVRLTPFLMTGPETRDLARRTAAEAIAAQNAGPDRLLAIAQGIAFALTAIDSLRLSLPEDLSLNMKLKLRGNAAALNRSAQRTAPAAHPAPLPDHAPVADPTAAPAADPDPTETLAALQAAQSAVKQAQTTAQVRAAQTRAAQTRAAQTPAAQTPVAQHDLTWAAAMTDVAAEFTAELPSLPVTERRTHLARIDALSEIATSLAAGTAPSLKARLLTSAALPAPLRRAR